MSIAAVKRKIQTMFYQGVASIVSDALIRQTMQIKSFNGETFSDVERWQNYGHTSVPPKGSEVLTVALGGNRSNLAIICAEDKRIRLKDLIEGDSALFHLEGHYFKLTKDGVIEGVGDDFKITVKRVTIAASERVELKTPLVKVTGDIKCDGNVSGKTGSFNNISSEGHSHDYDDNGETKRTKEPNE